MINIGRADQAEKREAQLFVNADHGLVNQYQNRETAVTGQSKYMQQQSGEMK